VPLSPRKDLERQQRRWADSAGVDYDARGFVRELDANLRVPLAASTRAAFLYGTELTPRKNQPARFSALHSSAVLVANVFDHWSARDAVPLVAALGLGAERARLAFEEPLATGVEGDPPLSDVVLRSESGIGIIILTGRGETVDRIIGLEMGADDYLPKPFHLRELLARVKSVLRRVHNRSSEVAAAAGARSRARFAGWNLDLASRELVSPSGEEVRLTTGEFDLLSAFVNNANQVLTRDRLLDLARNREAGPFDRTIDVQVGRLRRKLEDDPQNPGMIKTVRGSGYIFTPAVEIS